MLCPRSFLFTKIWIFPLTVSPSCSLGMVRMTALCPTMEWTSCLPSHLRQKGSPESVILLLHRKGNREHFIGHLTYIGAHQQPPNCSYTDINVRNQWQMEPQLTVTLTRPPTCRIFAAANPVIHALPSPSDPHTHEVTLIF